MNKEEGQARHAPPCRPPACCCLHHRCARARIAIEEIERLRAAGVRFGAVPADVALIFPISGRGGPRQRHVPDQKSQPAETIPTGATWRSISWRSSTKGRLSARFAALRVHVADGLAQRIGDLGKQHMPGEEVGIIGERRAGGERKFYLSNLPPGTSLRALAAAINQGTLHL